jgi:hypothetical protein
MRLGEYSTHERGDAPGVRSALRIDFTQPDPETGPR